MSRRILLALELVLAALSLWQIGEVAVAMAARLDAPFDLEWMEGASLVAGWRVQQGLPLHGAPTPDYIPFIYPPLHAWVLGALASVFPLGHPLGRAVSVVCTLGAAGALFAGARAAGARPAVALGCAALFAGCYAEGGTFYDLVRTDALALVLLGAALVVAVRPGARAQVVGGLLLALAFTAKHHAAAWGFPIAIALWRRDGWRAAARFALASAGPALVFLGWQQWSSDSRFLTWLLEVPATHGMVAKRLWLNVAPNGKLQGAQWELWSALPLTTTVALAGILAWRDRLYWGGAFVVALVVASLMRGHEGGYLNVLIPCLWVQALLPALLADRTARLAEVAPASGPRAALRFAPHALVVLVAAQVWQGRDDLRRFVPSPQDAERHAALVAEVAALPGPVLIPHAPWLAVQAGHAPGFALIALWDVDHDGGPFLAGVDAVKAALAEGYWRSAVVPDDKLGRGFAQHYRRVRSLRTTSVPTQTGWNVRLRQIWEPVVHPDGP
jgi:hypothetical protein